jgi:hypothetical protein
VFVKKSNEHKDLNPPGKSEGIVTFLILIFMSNLYNYPKGEKATLCNKQTCVTLYGKTAEVINAIALITATILAISLISKALK